MQTRARRVLLPALLLTACSAPTQTTNAAVTPASVVEPTEASPSSQPDAVKTELARLAVASTRLDALVHLARFNDEAKAADGGAPTGPKSQVVHDQIVQPLDELCISGDLDPHARSVIVELLSEAHDPRGTPCFTKVLGDYTADSAEDDLDHAARAVTALTLSSANAALFSAWTRLHVSKVKAQTYRDVYDAMVALRDPSWESDLILSLGPQTQPNSPEDLTRDATFWQTTACVVLGKLKSAAAVRPLIKVVLSPQKLDIASSALSALVEIGKPTVEATLPLLEGKDAELALYSEDATVRSREVRGHKVTPAERKAIADMSVETAAFVLAAVGRGEAEAPLLQALTSTRGDVSKAVIAQELPKLPKSAGVLKAFRTIYERLPSGVTLPSGNNGKEALIDVAASFFDPTVVPWLIKTAKDLKGPAEDVEPIRTATFSAILKVFTKDQVDVVDEFSRTKTQGANGPSRTLGADFATERGLAKELVTACSDRVDCYLARLVEPASQARATQFLGIKAAYMIGVYGKPDVRSKLVDAMPSLTNAAVRFVVLQVIDALSPQGDVAIAKRLQTIVDDAVSSKDQSRIALNAPFKAIIDRLNARAQ